MTTPGPWPVVPQDAARLAGFRVPVVLTAAAWEACMQGTDPAARLSALLPVAHRKVRTARAMSNTTARFTHETPAGPVALAASISPALITITLAMEGWQ